VRIIHQPLHAAFIALASRNIWQDTHACDATPNEGAPRIGEETALFETRGAGLQEGLNVYTRLLHHFGASCTLRSAAPLSWMGAARWLMKGYDHDA